MHRSDHDGVLPTFSHFFIYLSSYAIPLGGFAVGTLFQFLFFYIFSLSGRSFMKKNFRIQSREIKAEQNTGMSARSF
jgi:hypothetical protein